MDKHEQIQRFWNEQATKFKDSSLATSPDTVAFELELEQLKKRIPSCRKVLDIGCGNGIKGIELIKQLDIDYTGIDYADEMVKCANLYLEKSRDLLKGKAQFIKGDILKLKDAISSTYDFVVTSRCLINLTSIEEQVKAITNIYNVLKPEGKYLMIENSVQSLKNLNEVREIFGLDKINIRWHNLYIDEPKLFSKIESQFELVEMVPFASTYYLISRTLNALLTPEGHEIDYMSNLNKLSAKLPILGDYAPVKLFILVKK
jgi:ubiquinone/menaquinone biosynthesis C-methylase UbiE